MHCMQPEVKDHNPTVAIHLQFLYMGSIILKAT